MTKKRLSPTLFLVLSLGIFSATGLVGCSTHSAGGGDDESDAVPPPDAGTDTVPQASADAPPPTDGAPAATNPDGTPVAAADTPPPPADGGVPPGGADAPPPADASATPPAPDMAATPPAAPDASAPAVASAAPAAPTTSSATPPAMDTAPAPAPVAAAPAVASSDQGSGGTTDYTVRQGDTLMKIAFENYGDLYKWKDIYQQNHDAIKNPNDVPPGTVLKLDKPSVPVAIERNGDQYMIKSGDTLGTISNDVYGTKSKWKKLWENNKQLIKDPNKIYAGFYLFYTLTPSERKNLEERGGPGHAPAPLAQATEGDSNEAVSDSATDNSQNVAQTQAPAQGAMAPAQQPIAQAAQPMAQQAVAQAKTPQMDNRAPAAVVAKAPTQAGSDDLNQVVQQVH